jgi:hypothetical protein
VGAERGHLVGVNGDDQLSTRREMPVHRGVADPGLAGDVVERRVDTALTEDLPGGGQQSLVVALCVGPAGSLRLSLVWRGADTG